MAEFLSLSAAEYHARPEVSRSRLWSFYNSARKYYAEETGVIDCKAESEAMRLGSLVHAMLFEPHEVESFCVIPTGLLSSDGKATTKAAKEFKAENSSKCIVTTESWEAAKRTVESLKCSRFGQWISAPGAKREQSILWTDEETGIALRCRADLLLTVGSGVIVADLKTTQDASPRGFRYSVKEYGYWMQYAFYMDGIEAACGTRATEWYFVAAATKPPHEVGFYHLDLATKARAVDTYRQALRDYAAAKSQDKWRSSWDDQLTEISLRDWEF